MRFLALLLPAAAFCVDVKATWPNSTKTISWWYAADGGWRETVAQIEAHLEVVSSVQTYCGYQVSDDGRIIGDLSSHCAHFFPAITKLGVRAELTLGGGNCSIVSYRTLWADTTESPNVLLRATLAANASGLNIDLEPQSDSCNGDPTGTTADAAIYATWLAAVRDLFHTRGLRVTADVADWSPVLSEYATLAPAVDRLQDMETYNADSFGDWMSAYVNIINPTIPRAAAGIGLGVWLDNTDNGTWSITPASATQRVAQAIADGVQELAMFRLLPQANPAWPLDFWWDALLPFMRQ